MAGRRKHARVLIYSHDTFGLGHLRRCRAIAHALVEARVDLSVLILSGSPIIGSFDFRSRVDFVRIPGVIKLRNGEYTSLSLHIDIEDTLALRASIIRHTADILKPDIFIVDKEPLGLRGEVKDTLVMLKQRGTHLVLGLRDVMDEPAQLAPEWERKNAVPALRDLYDDIWIYGRQEICDPLDGIALPRSVRQKITYMGYLRRSLPGVPPGPGAQALLESGEPYILVTAGGGGDGDGLVDWVLRAYETDRDIPYRCLIVFGPFLSHERRAEFLTRVQNLQSVRAITFDAHVESLMAPAVGIVAMGGYNTFCEILSFDKRAILVPRTKPRLEQSIRASRAADLGLVRMLEDNGSPDPRLMASAIRNIGNQPRPSTIWRNGFMDGLENVNRRVGALLDRPAPPLVLHQA
ncbi:MAG: glycosyltransferase family protein [Thalassobaculales bacterium]